MFRVKLDSLFAYLLVRFGRFKSFCFQFARRCGLLVDRGKVGLRGNPADEGDLALVNRRDGVVLDLISS